MGQVQRTVHVPLGSDTERALGLPCQPASCQGGPGSVGLLPAAESDVRQPHRGGPGQEGSGRDDHRHQIPFLTGIATRKESHMNKTREHFALYAVAAKTLRTALWAGIAWFARRRVGVA